MFGRHPCLPINCVFNWQSPAVSITYPRYIDNRKSAMRPAYDIATLKSKARGERAKAYYDHKVRSSVLWPGDCVLIKNLSEHGGLILLGGKDIPGCQAKGSGQPSL